MENKPKVPGLKKLFIYTGSAALAAAAGAAGQMTFNVEDNRKFVLDSILFKVITVADNIALFSMLLARDNEKVFSDYVPCDAFGGNHFYNNSGTISLKLAQANGIPVAFKKPYIFPARSTIKVDLKNEYAIASTVYISLIGHNIYL